MLQPKIRRTIEKITFELNDELGTNYTSKEIEECVDTQYKVIKENIKQFNPDDESTFKDIRIPYLGKIYVAPSRIKYLKK